MAFNWKTLALGLIVAVAPAALHYFAGLDWTSMVGPGVAPFIVGAINLLIKSPFAE